MDINSKLEPVNICPTSNEQVVTIHMPNGAHIKFFVTQTDSGSFEVAAELRRDQVVAFRATTETSVLIPLGVSEFVAVYARG